MHPEEVAIDDRVIASLVEDQFPQWSGLSLSRIGSSGTVNVLYRLGDELVVRLPRVFGDGSTWAAGAYERDSRWLPQLARLLPVAVPEPLAQGRPTKEYPSDWGVYSWLPGENPEVDRLTDPERLARELAGFVRALHAVELEDGPEAGRGSSLARFDEATRAALAGLEGELDTRAALAAWERTLEVPEWTGPPVWVHGDLMPGNLLVQGAALTGVIDWGGAGLGDPAVDVPPAWNLFSGRAAEIFRDELGVDDETWERGRGWALWTGLVALPYYRETNPELAANARFRVKRVLAP